MNKVREAYQFAYEAHDGQVRKNGVPYMVHPSRVALSVGLIDLEPHYIIAALLHDVVEDTDVTLPEIYQTFGERVEYLVDKLTHKKGDSYFHYILNIVNDGRCGLIVIKYADIYDNWNDQSTEEAKRKYKDAVALFNLVDPTTMKSIESTIGRLT